MMPARCPPGYNCIDTLRLNDVVQLLGDRRPNVFIGNVGLGQPVQLLGP